MRIFEVSHRIEADMETYPGLPRPTTGVVVDYDASRERYQNKAEFFIGTFQLCGNTGTYVDSPRHRYRDGADLSDLPLERLADLPTVVVDATGAGRAIGAAPFARLSCAGGALLIRTGHSLHWRTPRYFKEHPFLTSEAVVAILAARPSFIGIDTFNIDDTDDPARPAHTMLLGAGIPICEHMTALDKIPEGGRLHAVPLAWAGGVTFPVRAYVVAP